MDDSHGIACVSIMSPDNNPIFIQKYGNEIEELEMDSLIFCSLDFFETKVGHKSTSKNDSYLGNIQNSDQFQVWGFKPGLNYKIIILTYHTQAIIPYQTMISTFKKIQDLLFNAFMNPFYVPFSLLDSNSRFKDMVQTIVNTFPVPPEINK